MKTAARHLLAALALSLGVTATATAQTGLRITEWMYNPVTSAGEFFELTNFGPTAIDLTGWVYDDDSRLSTVDPLVPTGGSTGGASLSALGLLAPGESAIVTEANAATFRSQWSLAAAVKVLGGITNNMGRNDEINIFDGAGALVARLTYGDQNQPGTVRTLGISGNPGSNAVLLGTTAAGWVLSSTGDAFGSYASSAGDVGNPGIYAPIPEPAEVALMLAGLAVLGAAARARRAGAPR